MEVMQGRARSWQETVNRRFKDCVILKEVFCHDIPKHAEVIYADAVITQIAIDNDEKLVQVNYCDV